MNCAHHFEGLPLIHLDLLQQDFKPVRVAVLWLLQEGAITEIPRRPDQLHRSGVGVWGCPDCLP
jgi:hypothetical protein